MNTSIPIDRTDDQIIAVMGKALGFMPAEVIASKIDRDGGQAVVVLRRGAKLLFNFTLTEPTRPPVLSAPELIVEPPVEDAPTIDVGEAPAEKPKRRRRPA